MRRTSATAIVLSTFLALMLAAFVPQASAQVAPSLQGEALFAGLDEPTQNAGFFDATCENGTMTFTAEGLAFGPYPGTFIESGRVTFDPATGELFTFEASFTINSVDAIVSGTKELAPPIPSSVTVNQAGCFETADTFFFSVASAFSYEAEIHSTTLGSFSDHGYGDVIGQEFDLEASESDGPVASQMQEYFLISTGVAPLATNGHTTGGGWIGDSTNDEHVSFGFTARKDDERQARGHCTVIDHATDTKIRCLTVDSIAQVGTHATFRGQAEVNGVLEGYRIDVDDLSEPGTLDTFKIDTDSYDAAGVLTGGNIQIHKEP